MSFFPRSERLASTIRVNLGLPKFNGIDLPPPPAPTAPAPAAPAPAAPAAPGVSVAAYAINPADHAKYYALFLNYDTAKAG
jgi:hypothetical protein